MSAEPPSSFPLSGPARQARAMLSAALELLQQDERAEQLAPAIDSAAAASSALYDVEKSSTTTQAATAGIHIAVERLGAAIASLQVAERESGIAHPATELIAHTLAVLYPVAQARLRQRRAVVLEPGSVASDSLRGLANVPPAPEASGRPRPSLMPHAEKRSSGARVFLEVDIGLLSDSNFYTGLSQDLSRGGLFVATYQPKPAGTTVRVYFVLPDGHEVNADGVVRWTREESDDSPPGMGIAFQTLQDDDQRAIERFCEERAPLYHDSADD
jgi:uncharacterized protein (TIGR02266 family)